MTDAQILKDLSVLPDNLKQEVADFIAFLKTKVQPVEKKTRPIGLLKGKIHIQPNFDDPIDDIEARAFFKIADEKMK